MEVSEYWLVDPEGKNVEVFCLHEKEYELAERLGFGDMLTSPLFPGLKLAVASLWENWEVSSASLSLISRTKPQSWVLKKTKRRPR